MLTPVLLLFVVTLHCAVQATSVEYAQKLCRTEDDCDWDQCCVEAETRLPGFNGICSTPTQKGEVCNPNPRDKTDDGRYRIACPCDEGLSCQLKQKMFMNKIHDLHVCEP